MIVKCLKNKLDEPNSRIINSNLENYLEIGSKFEVYGIRILRNVTYIIILLNDHLIEVPLGLFEIEQNDIPNYWKISLSGEEIRFWPSIFYTDFFFDNFSDRNEKERSEFEKLMASNRTTSS